ncbi:hypothetical protein JT359_16795 [Candidatus Poribacteria bacterium]|nr:hypothetical protein [Candidatus Poribacteria bacterium]
MLTSGHREMTLVTLFIIFSLCFTSDGLSEEKTSTLSGHIIDSDGKPVTDISIVLIYMTVDENGIKRKYSSKYYPFLVQLPLLPSDKNEIPPDEEELRKYPPYIKTKTNHKGEFTFVNVAEGNVQFLILPKLPEGKEMSKPVPGNPGDFAYPEIQYVKFGEVSFYPQQFSFFPLIGAVTFGIAPRTNIENIELRVNIENPLNIRGRIVFKDGSPVVDATLRINIGKLNLDENIEPHANKSLSLQTNDDGSFNQPVWSSGIYAISVYYRGLSAISDPFILNGDIPNDVLNLRLDGNHSEIEELQTDNDDDYYPLPKKHSNWIMNPLNGHLYKRIICESRDDAATKAAQENAYLVTITSEAEQIWLEAVFGSEQYWIGLTDVDKEGKWKWDNGEKNKYSNWIKYDASFSKTPPMLRFFGVKNEDEKRENEENDYAIMHIDDVYMKWKAVDMQHSEEGRTRLAVIEKP